MECPRCSMPIPEGENCPVCSLEVQPPGVEPQAEQWQDSVDEVEAAANAATAAEAAATAATGTTATTDGTAYSPSDVAPEESKSGPGDVNENDPPPVPGSTEIDANEVGDVITVNGNRAAFVGAVNNYNYYGATSEVEEETVAALLEKTTEFELDSLPWAALDAEEVARHARVLAEEGLLLVSCVDRSLARAAVQAVVAALELEPARVRLLGFGRLGTDQASLTIHDLLKWKVDTDTRTIVVADADSVHAQPFLDSLLGRDGAFLATYVRRSLAQRKLRLVCLAEPSRYAALTRAGEESGFTHWTVPFLEPFLRREFAGDHEALHSAILRQRDEGRWSRDDAELWHQVRTFWGQGRLREVVVDGGIRVQPMVVDEQRPMHQIVLFTAAFFTALSSTDFDRVVTALLGDATIPMAVPTAPGASETAAPAAHRDKPLAQLWRECADRIRDECGLVVMRDPAARQVVEFREPGARDALRRRLEEEYPFHLHTTFDRLHGTGLLFAGSDAVAANVVRVTAHMAEGHPETYGRDWVVGMLVVSRVRTADTLPLHHVMRRFGELLRELSARPAVRPLVEQVLNWLLGVPDFHATVFALAGQLRFAPEFDVLRWLRQLIDRGDANARAAAFTFLYRELLAVGGQVYPTLHTLADWLPPEDARTGRYSLSQRYALRLLVEYAATTAARFDPECYGERPVRYPLLAVGAETGRRDLGLLVRWLLHPGISEAVRDGIARRGIPRLVAALVAEWTFILFGPHEIPTPPRPDTARPGAPVALSEAAEPGDAQPRADGDDGAASPEYVFEVLLEELTARTRTREGREAGREMLSYWQEMTRLHLPSPKTSRAARKELEWKRGLFRALLLRYRALQTAPAPSAPTP